MPQISSASTRWRRAGRFRGGTLPAGSFAGDGPGQRLSVSGKKFAGYTA